MFKDIFKCNNLKIKRIDDFTMGIESSSNKFLDKKLNGCIIKLNENKATIISPSKEIESIENDKDVAIIKIILHQLKGCISMHTNFSPYIKGVHNMLFVDSTSEILGIGLTINGGYVIQKINPDAKKYENKLIYEEI